MTNVSPLFNNSELFLCRMLQIPENTEIVQDQNNDLYYALISLITLVHLGSPQQ